MNKKAVSYRITTIFITLFIVVGLLSCVTAQWKDLSYSGETGTKVLEGNIWSYVNKSWPAGREPIEVEFQSNGKVISSNNWRNASYEKRDTDVKIVLENGKNHIVGKYDAEKNTITGTIFNSDDTSSEIIMEYICKAGSPSGVTYRIGDRGPAGGIIFYDKNNYFFGWRYMECSPVDLPNAQWGLLGIYADVTTGGSRMGLGKQNTERLIEALSRNGETRRAAQLCNDYTLNGYSDWFLPSYDEITAVYNNVRAKGQGDFRGELYWSSSQGGRTMMGTHNAFAKDFNVPGAPYPGVFGKDMVASVRAVRLVMER